MVCVFSLYISSKLWQYKYECCKFFTVCTGKLHNLARAVADEEIDRNHDRGEAGNSDQKMLLNFHCDGVLGLGLNASKTTQFSPAAGETSVPPAAYEIKDTGKKFFGPLSSKPATYLSAFILYVATIGDIVDGIDTTHDFNFFSLAYEWPRDVSYLFTDAHPLQMICLGNLNVLHFLLYFNTL